MSNFFYGVIEGFYGRQWSWRDRSDYASFLAEHGFDCYIYAPKGDVFLRSHWREPLPQAQFSALHKLGEHYKNSGLRWGLGLSPLGLFEHFDARDRELLIAKVRQINTLAPDVLCILFDDLRGDIPGLAQRQLEIVELILAHSDAAQTIVCPTYYSFDPVLEEVFGTMPEGYLEQLGAGLDDDIGIFWTGSKVISEQFTEDDIGRAAAVLGRKPVLWDNYPVNDGRLTSNYLHLRPYQGRDSNLRKLTAGHLVNPMNQPHLSRLVLQSLQAVYRDGSGYNAETAWQCALLMLGDEDLASQLAADCGQFNHGGLSAMSAADQSRLRARYESFRHPVANEIIEWLDGGYQFDPACLTE